MAKALIATAGFLEKLRWPMLTHRLRTIAEKRDVYRSLINVAKALAKPVARCAQLGHTGEAT